MIMKEKDFEDNLKFYKEKFEELFKNVVFYITLERRINLEV